MLSSNTIKGDVCNLFKLGPWIDIINLQAVRRRFSLRMVFLTFYDPNSLTGLSLKIVAWPRSDLTFGRTIWLRYGTIMIYFQFTSKAWNIFYVIKGHSEQTWIFKFLETSRMSSHAVFVPESFTVTLWNILEHSTAWCNYNVMLHK